MIDDPRVFGISLLVVVIAVIVGIALSMRRQSAQPLDRVEVQRRRETSLPPGRYFYACGPLRATKAEAMRDARVFDQIGGGSGS